MALPREHDHGGLSPPGQGAARAYVDELVTQLGMRDHVYRTLLLFVALVTVLPVFPDSLAEDAAPGDHAKPLKVFILAGQSNMQGHAHVRTFDHIGMDPETLPLLQEMRADDGTPRVCDDVWISYLSSEGERQGRLTAGFGANGDKIGPEFTFGIYAAEAADEPILIIKTAWGGKSLHTDFRPPSAGPYAFDEAQLERAPAAGQGRRGHQGREGQGDGALLPPDDRPREAGPGRHPTGLSRAKAPPKGTSWPASSGSRAGTTWSIGAPIPNDTSREATASTPLC